MASGFDKNHIGVYNYKENVEENNQHPLNIRDNLISMEKLLQDMQKRLENILQTLVCIESQYPTLFNKN